MTIYYLTIATLAGLGYVLTDTRKQGAHKGQKNSRLYHFWCSSFSLPAATPSVSTTFLTATSMK